MQPDRFALARYWLASADNDFVVAREYVKRIPTVACFHAQQGAEKALKALLVATCGDAPRTHVASELVAELDAADQAPPADVGADARSLDKYYAPTRYPDALGGGNPDTAFVEADAEAAISAADRVYSYCVARTRALSAESDRV